MGLVQGFLGFLVLILVGLLVIDIWHSIVKQGTVPLLDQEAQLLPHPPAHHLLLVPGVPGLGLGHPVDGVHGDGVPAAQGLDGQRDEGDAGGQALVAGPGEGGAHLPVVGEGEGMAGGDRRACQVALLERVRHRDVERRVAPAGEARDEDVRWARARPAGDEALGLPASAAVTAVWYNSSLRLECRAIRSPWLPQQRLWSPSRSLCRPQATHGPSLA